MPIDLEKFKPLDLPETFDTAQELLDMEPMPPNWRQIMDRLKEQTPEEFHAEFGDLIEAARAKVDY
jgi:hypothetical protein